jgi:hypothetical protein
MTGFLSRKSFFRGRSSALPSDTRGRSRMPELGTYGSVRGAAGNSRPYRECRPHEGGAAHTGAGVRKPPKEMLWGGGEDIASIVADVNRWSPPCRS